jgi:hypothetical protein
LIVIARSQFLLYVWCCSSALGSNHLRVRCHQEKGSEGPSPRILNFSCHRAARIGWIGGTAPSQASPVRSARLELSHCGGSPVPLLRAFRIFERNQNHGMFHSQTPALRALFNSSLKSATEAKAPSLSPSSSGSRQLQYILASGEIEAGSYRRPEPLRGFSRFLSQEQAGCQLGDPRRLNK